MYTCVYIISILICAYVYDISYTLIYNIVHKSYHIIFPEISVRLDTFVSRIVDNDSLDPMIRIEEILNLIVQVR